MPIRSKVHSPNTQDPSPSRPRIVYKPAEPTDLEYSSQISDPGQFPYTRGIHPEMYQRRLWTMRQYAGYATAAQSNQRYRYLLDQGTTGLSVAFDLPTQIGYDSDHQMARGEVGRVGVAIDSLKDMETLFQGIPLEQVSTSMTINATAPILMALYLAVAKRQGVPWNQLRGTVQNDILKEYVARGTYIYPPQHSLRLVTDICEFCARHAPRWNTISVSGYHIREAGSTAAQEIAFTLGNGLTYVKAALERGLQVDEFAPRLSFFFNAHNNLLEEVAKYRAARRLWARQMRERFDPANPRSLMLRFHTQTAGSMLTAQQPENNVVRVAYQALAAVLGGTQSLHTNSRDEALGLPTEAAATLALRSQQILAHETGVPEVVDPLGGSWYIEEMTTRLEEEALDYLTQVDDLGGMLGAIEKGFVQAEIQDAAFQYQKQIESKNLIVVGVNQFQSERESPIAVLRIDPQVERDQVERLQAVRQKRTAEAVSRNLESLRVAAQGEENLMPSIVSSVEALATVGEIAETLRSVFGEHREAIVL